MNSNDQRQIKYLERRLRRVQVLTSAMAVTFVVVICMASIGHVYASDGGRNASFGTITVKRIDVVENNGTRRLVIAGADNMPPPVINGKAYKRAISPAGIAFYNDKGEERGGIGLAPRSGGEQSALVFDYNHGDGIGLIRRQRPGHTEAGLDILDPPPAGEFGHGGNPRVQVQVVNGDSQIVLRDAKGAPRLRFSVSKNGDPEIEFLDSNGKVTRQISAGGNSEPSGSERG
jgi:hypothetical protein